MFKYKYLKVILFLSLGAVIFLTLYNIFLVYPTFLKLLIKDIENEAIQAANHLISVAKVENFPLAKGDIPEVIIKEGKFLQDNFFLRKLNFFSPLGEIIYSTDPQDIGKINTKPYFQDTVMQGKPLSKLLRRGEASFEGQQIFFDVLETYVPVMQNKKFLGAFKLYYGINRRKRDFDKLIANSSYILSAVTLILLIISVIILRQAKRRLRRQDKEEKLLKEKQRTAAANEAKSLFLANMSHEIRTPMTCIRGYTDILKHSSLNESQRKQLDIVSRNGDLLISLINDVLDISKIEARQVILENINFNLEYLVSNVFEIIEPRVNKNKVKLYYTIQEEIFRNYEGDPTRIRQILLNLLGNAVKSTEKGEIRIRVSLPEVSSSDSARLFASDKKAEETEDDLETILISVKDTGIGIPEAKQKIIFECFRQVEASATRRHRGTGLGLSITKALIAMMGGELWVESEEGKGSNFMFTLKLAKAKSSPRLKVSGGSLCLKNLKVLVVEDDRNVSRIVEIYCQNAGMTVYSIASSEETLNWLTDVYTEIPDIIIANIRMPKIDGYELAERIKADTKLAKIRLIALTSEAMPGTAKRSQECGFEAYLTKPVSEQTLLQAMRIILAGSLPKDQIVTKHTIAELSLVRLKGLKILIVEDEEDIREVLSISLGRLGCEIEGVSDGKQAIEKLKANKYDLVLMDIIMPVMGGEEATEIIRKGLGLTLPIIALTAIATKDSEEKCLALGMNDYVAKPVSSDRLQEIILKWV